MLDPFVGVSPFAEQSRRMLPSLAGSRETLLIVGERGTGKAFLASHIHARTGCALSLDVLNCAIATERSRRLDLLGAEPPELTTSKRSILELPTTVVVKHADAAGEFLQGRLAEALRDGRVVRLGGEEPHPVAARLILTFRNPILLLRKEERISAALFETLSRCRTIVVPPLRERPEDVSHLARYYYDRFHARFGRGARTPDPHLPQALLQFLRRQPWDDNVRDLVACVRSLFAFAPGGSVEPEKLELMKMLTLLEDGNEFSLEESMAVIRRCIIARAARKQNGHQGKTAELLGLSDREIRRKLSR